MARYHQSKKARHAEHMGMERHERGPVKPMGHYEGEYNRRMEEMREAGMIHEDRHAIANLPQEVMIKPYPKSRHYMGEGMDDTISGIDHQMEADTPRGPNFAPHKF